MLLLELLIGAAWGVTSTIVAADRKRRGGKGPSADLRRAEIAAEDKKIEEEVARSETGTTKSGTQGEEHDAANDDEPPVVHQGEYIKAVMEQGDGKAGGTGRLRIPPGAPQLMLRLLPPAARPKSRTRVAGLAFCANLLRSSFLYDPPLRCAQKLVELLQQPPGTADSVDTARTLALAPAPAPALALALALALA